ncbi:hypothetical protein [Larkinella terrae]|uniref:Uncharacterized protein n=1 Tax=Larkinella terrae TaxID=2025311 RepID=A0A7K0EUW4_9BACT|nr:hypothetical protein [Larkinella terrae]MRS65238.1 hypothetical protein [Larkinella terrae]
MQIRGYYSDKRKCQVWLKHSPQLDLSVIPDNVRDQLGELKKMGTAELIDVSNFAKTIAAQGYCVTKHTVTFGCERVLVD